jgi:general stress protein 26
MTTPAEAAASIREMLTVALDNHREAVLTTVDAAGQPHAAWMGTVTSPDFAHLITLTGTHTDKVANIRSNPRVEWMFTSPDRKIIIYFEGEAEVLADETMKDRYLRMVPEESRGFFMKHYRSGGEWCVIKTRIDCAVYCMPAAYTKVRLGADQFRPRPMAIVDEMPT